MKKDDVLVSAELAKEKLARVIWLETAFTQPELAQLIRNTDLTDCQQTENLLRDEYKRMRRECMYWKERAMCLEEAKSNE